MNQTKESSHKSNVLVLVFDMQTLIWFRVRGLAASAGRPIHTGDIISPECPRSAPGAPPGWTGAPYPSLINANAKSRVLHQGLTRSFSLTCIIMSLLFLHFLLHYSAFFWIISHPKLHLFTSLLLPLLTILTLPANCQSASRGGFILPLPTSTTRFEPGAALSRLSMEASRFRAATEGDPRGETGGLLSHHQPIVSPEFL